MFANYCPNYYDQATPVHLALQIPQRGWRRWLSCSESLYFVGLAMSTCLLPSSPRPTCKADSSAALTATAPARSLVHAWPCSAPLQPLLPLPSPAPSLLDIFCAHLTFHHSLSCPISHFPPRFPYAFLTVLCSFWHIYCLDTGFERLPLVRLPCERYRWRLLILFFPKSPNTLQSYNFHILFDVTCIRLALPYISVYR
jgi:hypothetical protein